MAEYSISTMNHDCDGTDSWENFVNYMFVKYHNQCYSTNRLREFLTVELYEFSATWDQDNCRVNFNNKESFARFVLTYG